MNAPPRRDTGYHSLGEPPPRKHLIPLGALLDDPELDEWGVPVEELGPGNAASVVSMVDGFRFDVSLDDLKESVDPWSTLRAEQFIARERARLAGFGQPRGGFVFRPKLRRQQQHRTRR